MRKILVLFGTILLAITWLQAQPSLKKMQDAIRAAKSTASSKPEVNLSEKMTGQGSVRFPVGSGMKTSQAITWLKTQSGFRPGKDELLADPAGLVTVSNIRIEKYQQYYQGIPVEHGRVNINSTNDLVNTMQLELYAVPDNLKLTPSINESQALSKAIAYVGAKKYSWDNNSGNDPSISKPVGTLVIVQDIFQKVGQISLAYKFKISSVQPLSKSYVYVNAENGAVIFLDAIIKHATGSAKNITGNSEDSASSSPFVNASGSAQTRYSGSQVLIADQRDTSFHLRELRNGDSIITLNYQRRGYSEPNMLLVRDFNDLDNNWTSAEYDNANWDNAALDAHFGLEKVSDYWNTVQGRSGWDNAHGKFISHVHVRDPDFPNDNFDNAFWDGETMNYGDGSYLSGGIFGFLPLTALDVTAHELGHGVCQETAGLVYQREAGGLNEAFSDIWAACVEHYANLGGAKREFLIGEEIYPLGGSLRSMSNPKAASNPDTYGGQYWRVTTLEGCPGGTDGNDYCGVHNNSGVLNKWFYLLTQGAAATNDLGSRYSVTGVGFTKSEKIVYLTELMLTPNSDFAATRQASINAASMLFGACANEVIQVTNAWFAVGVGGSADCSPLVEFNAASVSISEAGESRLGCNSRVFNVPVKLPVAATAPITLTFAASGTAVSNIDYSFPSATLVFAPGESGIKNFPVNIIDDGSNDGTKTLQLSYTFNGGGGNGGQSPNNQIFTISILDNDFTPGRILATPVTLSTLINENFESNTSALPTGWREVVSTNSRSINKWIVAGNGGAGISGQAAYISSDTTNKSLVYSDADSLSTLRYLVSNAVSTRNLWNLRLSFKCKANGEVYINSPDGSDLWDFGALYYSLNGTTFTPMINPATGYLYRFYGRGSEAFNVGPLSLPAAMNNQTTLYLGFGWTNDAIASGITPFLVDDILLTGTTAGTTVKATAGQSGSTNILAGNYDSYIYSTLDSQLITRVSNVNQGVGCVTASITSHGNGLRTIQGMQNFPGTQKVIDISPATVNSSATNTVTLYYTAAELAIWGANKTKLKMLKIKSGVDLNGPISSADVQIVDPVSVLDSSATTGIITYRGNFTGFSQYLLADPNIIVPVTWRDFKVAIQNEDAKLEWETEVEINNKGYEILRSYDGIQFEKIAFVDGKGNRSGVSKYEFTDAKVPSNITIYYRLRQVDLDQRSMLSNVVSTRLARGQNMFISIWPNPASDVLNISFAARVTKGRISILSPEGQVLQEQTINRSVTGVPVKLGKLHAGLYLIRYSDGIKTETQKFLKK